MIPRDKFGWPVVTIIGRPVLNVIRLILHTDIGETWRGRRHAGPGHYRKPSLREAVWDLPTIAISDDPIVRQRELIDRAAVLDLIPPMTAGAQEEREP